MTFSRSVPTKGGSTITEFYTCEQLRQVSLLYTHAKNSHIITYISIVEGLFKRMRGLLQLSM